MPGAQRVRSEQSVSSPDDLSAALRRQSGTLAAELLRLQRSAGNAAVGHLEADPTLQVRLVGHAWSEGNAEQNVALSSRRARAVFAALEAKGLGARVMDFVGGKDPAGCKRLEFGVWACGAAQATPGEARPEDRKVAATFLRNAPPKLGPLTLPTASWSGASWTNTPSN